MAITQCPACDKKISDKAKVCPHCNTDLVNRSSEDIDRLELLKDMKKRQRLQAESFAAVILLLVGFGLWIFGDNLEPVWLRISQVALAAGFLWYVIVRVRVALYKRS